MQGRGGGWGGPTLDDVGRGIFRSGRGGREPLGAAQGGKGPRAVRLKLVVVQHGFVWAVWCLRFRGRHGRQASLLAALWCAVRDQHASRLATPSPAPRRGQDRPPRPALEAKEMLHMRATRRRFCEEPRANWPRSATDDVPGQSLNAPPSVGHKHRALVLRPPRANRARAAVDLRLAVTVAGNRSHVD